MKIRPVGVQLYVDELADRLTGISQVVYNRCV